MIFFVFFSTFYTECSLVPKILFKTELVLEKILKLSEEFFQLDEFVPHDSQHVKRASHNSGESPFVNGAISFQQQQFSSL
jgi:hypothetical protein